MSSAFGGEFFSQLRYFASTLDRDCNELKSGIENDEVDPDGEGRSHLVLRGILSEVKQLKNETNCQVQQSKQISSFSQVFSACERLAEHTKEQIDNVEEHLNKYGYKSPGELTSVDSIYGTPFNGSEQESPAMETDDTDDNTQSDDNDEDVMETDGQSNDAMGENASSKKPCLQDDLMSSPVKPDTFTPMIQATPPKTSAHNDGFTTPDQSPVPPQTTTPLVKAKMGLESSETEDTPPLPATFTPFMSSKSNRIEQQMSPTCSPLPPVFNTPGLRMRRAPGDVAAHGLYQTQSPVNLPEDYGTPAPPDLTCTILMQPGELEAARQEQLNLSDVKESFAIQPVIEQEYQTLPDYIKTQFSIEDINKLLLNISKYFKTEENYNHRIKENALRNAFNLGRKTKTFMLTINKLGRAKVINGEIIFQ